MDKNDGAEKDVWDKGTLGQKDVWVKRMCGWNNEWLERICGQAEVARQVQQSAGWLQVLFV